MLVTFQSQATSQLVMISAHAEALLKLLGKTAAEPGILEVADMPQALAALHALASVPDRPPRPPATEGLIDRHLEDETEVAFQDEPVSLRQRAAPLIRLIEQAQAGGKPIVWGV